MHKSVALSIVAGLAVAGVAKADFLITSGNAAFNPSFTNPSWGASLSNTTRPYQNNTAGNVGGAESYLYTDVPGAFTASSLGNSAVRAFRWDFRNAGGSNGGTAGKGLSGTAGGLSSYTQTFTAGSNTGTIDWVDVFETSRSRINASITYTIFDGAAAGDALVKCVATFTNKATVNATETYDFFNIVDSQILGVGTGANDVVAPSVSGTQSILTFSDTVSGSPYSVAFKAESPSYWEANTSTNIGNKVFSGANNANQIFSGTGGSTAGVNNVGVGADPHGGFQWRVTLAQNQSVTLTSYIVINNAPTPGALSLLGLGGLVAARRRRA